MRTREEEVDGVEALRVAHADVVRIEAGGEVEREVAHPAHAAHEKGLGHVHLGPDARPEEACTARDAS